MSKVLNTAVWLQTVWVWQPDHQWEFGEINIRSCMLPNQTGLRIRVGTSTGIAQNLTRVQLPFSLCLSCWSCRGVEILRAGSCHASQLTLGWDCGEGAVISLSTGTAAAAVWGTVLCTLWSKHKIKDTTLLTLCTGDWCRALTIPDYRLLNSF